ncbi:MAG: HNH endonuclease [Gammaproteobacteria bacterium HGW-Gammaproteobacteria-15]|nr:MAG: HNH endonuclease [Gammaproteobacteria bacterium HGW-Gammaproteobacteria-15]
MPLTKKQREALKPMFGGRCAYCGCKLGSKWHADHVEAIYRGYDTPTGLMRPHNERLDNYFPACVPCNLFKTTFSVDEFRMEISKQVERGRKSSVNFRTAERFGLIQEVQKPVVFWFEKYQQKAGAA